MIEQLLSKVSRLDSLQELQENTNVSGLSTSDETAEQD
jgi:hypothetical protein